MGKALRAEQEQGRILDSTSDVMRDYVNMIQAKKNIEDGQELNLNVNNTISSLLDELDDREDDDFIEFDADKEQTKEEIKKLRKQGITDLLDEL